jgi:hypothetical protein
MSTGCEDLQPFLDGTLPEAEQQRIRRHLAGCDVCSKRFHDLLQLEMLARLALEDAAESERWVSARQPRETLPVTWDDALPADWPGSADSALAAPPSAREGQAWHDGARRFRRHCPGCASCCPWFAPVEAVETVRPLRWPCPRAGRSGALQPRPRSRR